MSETDVDGCGTGQLVVDEDKFAVMLAEVRPHLNELLLLGWQKIGQAAYPHAARLLITADAGGSKSTGCGCGRWSRLAEELGLQISVSHFPPGTSKWNRIKHRLFAQISMNWRGRPLTSHEVIFETIAATTTKTGLTVQAALDTGTYQKGIKISDKEMTALERRSITRHSCHGEWNHCLLPAPRPTLRK